MSTDASIPQNPFREQSKDPLAHLRARLSELKGQKRDLSKEEREEADLLSDIAAAEEENRAPERERRLMRLRRGKLEAEKRYPDRVIGTMDLDAAGIYVLFSATRAESDEYAKKLSEVTQNGGSTTAVEYNFVRAHLAFADPPLDSQESRTGLTEKHGFALTSLLNKLAELSALQVNVNRSKSG